MSPTSSASGMNSPGRIFSPRRGIAPAHERFEAREAAVVQAHDGLVLDAEFFVLDRGAQIAGERETARGLVMHVMVEEGVPAAAERLRVVHRGVGVAQHLFDALLGRLDHRDPDRRRRVHRAAFHQHRGDERVLDRLDRVLDLAQIAPVREEQRELVAADARDEVVRADGRAHALADRHEQRVARHVAERVVDRLELVEVDEEHGVDAVGIRARVLQRGGETFLEERPVGQAGQRVVRGLVAQPRLVGLEQAAALDLGAVCLRVGQRKPHEVDEELQPAERLAGGDLAVSGTVGAEIPDHLALRVAQHDAQRVALVPRVGGRARRVAVRVAGEDCLLPVEFALRRDVVCVVEDFVVRREDGEDFGLRNALVFPFANGALVVAEHHAPGHLAGLVAVRQHDRHVLEAEQVRDPTRDRLQGEIELAEA